MNWTRAVGKENGFVVVIVRSDIGGIGRKTILTLGCERSGKYRPLKNDLKRKGTGTKKCQCPFRLRGRPLKNGEGWKLKVLCGFHNHDTAVTLEGHPYAGRLGGNEKSLLEDMTKNMVKASNVLLTLKDRDEGNVTSIKQVYNARQAYRASERGPRTEMQHLIKCLERDEYVYWHRRVDVCDVVRDIFWTHPDAIKLLNMFPIVLIMDSTYKTNKYRLPLLEIVGVTSTELTFSVAFAYLESERTDNFTWALQKLRELIVRHDAMPHVIVTDRDIALMNAVESVFPTSRNLLCQFHINKNVKAKCKLMVHPKEQWDLVMDAWTSVIDSPNEGDYDIRVSHLENICSPFLIFCEYVKNTWLIPHKEKFVSAWIDKVMHLGNTTSNRYVRVYFNIYILIWL